MTTSNFRPLLPHTHTHTHTQVIGFSAYIFVNENDTEYRGHGSTKDLVLHSHYNTRKNLINDSGYNNIKIFNRTSLVIGRRIAFLGSASYIHISLLYSYMQIFFHRENRVSKILLVYNNIHKHRGRCPKRYNGLLYINMLLYKHLLRWRCLTADTCN